MLLKGRKEPEGTAKARPGLRRLASRQWAPQKCRDKGARHRGRPPSPKRSQSHSPASGPASGTKDKGRTQISLLIQAKSWFRFCQKHQRAVPAGKLLLDPNGASAQLGDRETAPHPRQGELLIRTRFRGQLVLPSWAFPRPH